MEQIIPRLAGLPKLLSEVYGLKGYKKLGKKYERYGSRFEGRLIFLPAIKGQKTLKWKKNPQEP